MIELIKYHKLFYRMQQIINSFVYDNSIIKYKFFFVENKTYSTYSELQNSKTLEYSFLRIVE